MITKSRLVTVDIIKLLACFMIVILHIIENAGDAARSIYLLGSFGIPLFFMVNGYLLYGKDFSFIYVKKKILIIIRFMLFWIVPIGLIMCIKSRSIQELFNVAVGALIGKGYLFHLWFLFALVVIYILCFLLHRVMIFYKKSFMDLITIRVIFAIILLQSVLFIINFFLFKNAGVEIREIIPAPLRILTNGGYFIIGMYIRKFQNKLEEQLPKKNIALVILTVNYCAICFISHFTGIVWASSYYDSIFVVAGSMIIMLTILKSKFVENDRIISVINMFDNVTIGVWLLHPFIYKIVVRALILINIEQNLLIRMLELLIIFLLCVVTTKLAFKTKILKKFVEL